MVKSSSLLLVLLLSAPSAHADVDIRTVMDRRWSVSLAYGAASLGALSSDTDAHLLGAMDLAVRLRLRPEIQVGLSFGGSITRELVYFGLLGELRYRFKPEFPWSPFVLAGAGIGGIESSGVEPVARLGLGIERRFQSWGFTAEGRGTIIGGDDSVMPTNVESTLQHYGAWDASLIVSATYYWGRGRPSRRLTP